MSQEFAAGDVVMVKSGGPRMTVSNVGDYYGQPTIWCVWFEGKQQNESTFAPEILKKVDETQRHTHRKSSWIESRR